MKFVEKKMHEVMVQVRLLAILSHVDIRRDPSCPAQSPALRLRAACSWNDGAKAPKVSLSPRLAESDVSRQQLLVSIRGIGVAVIENP